MTTASERVRQLEREHLDLWRMFAAVIEQVGGEVRVTRDTFDALDSKPKISMYQDPATGAYVFATEATR